MPKDNKELHRDKAQRKSKEELVTEGYMVAGRKKDDAKNKAKDVVKKRRDHY